MLGNETSASYDISFMATLKCDLECPFCMYDSSPEKDDIIDFDLLSGFIKTIDMDMVNAFGFYGGEPAVAMNLFGEVVELLPPQKPKFVITNGAWSTNPDKTEKFLSWAKSYNMKVFVSGTKYHQKFQDLKILEELANNGSVILKEPDSKMLPMGKLSHAHVKCSKKCLSYKCCTRIAVRPDNAIIFQNCDGVYPVIGNIGQDFGIIHQMILDKKYNCSYMD